MVNTEIPDSTQLEVNFAVSFGDILPENARDVTIREVTLGESLLTPGLQTSVLVDSFLHVSADNQGKGSPPKNFDNFKDKIMGIVIERPLLDYYDMQWN